ncbi:LPXTG cell wall anchor domain-containing protein [Streptomyces sp. ME01-18h]|uniref:LPXTG cell wall anchor domain-containing protein n=1 Tax=Streptomyces sp. ME01-18h TaxID=462920 RepID=UPI0029B86CDA|nr:LPXTG cell wall anchor domain-containing protein [Streptomyces sp. ME01-18h]MDX3404568.1 LPXTG cell wall anchor domain-containing protein [Streptomyces sp. ME01-18h]
MKIRRSLALAAATAVIAPATLLVAPAAYARDDSPSPSVSETAPAQEESTPAADDTAPTGEDTTPAEEESTPAAGESSPAASDPAAPGASPSATVSTAPSASAPATDAVECSDEDMTFDDDLHTGLSGLPSKIVAGSGFHSFKLNVDNKGSHAYQRVDLGVFAAQINENDFFVDTGHLTLQYKDPATGTWTDISLDDEDEGAGYLGYTDIKAKEYFSIDLRLAVDKKAPSGLGFAISIGMYADDEGNCVYSGDDSYYDFDILAAGSTPTDTGDAKPQGGSKPLPTKPVGDTQIDPQGRLAETGSSSALPTIALAGGAAVALGVGTMFVVRRRKSANTGATA